MGTAGGRSNIRRRIVTNKLSSRQSSDRRLDQLNINDKNR
nr:MAG TPA: hypothetical protein [Caudoviricetes sp.]